METRRGLAVAFLIFALAWGCGGRGAVPFPGDAGGSDTGPAQDAPVGIDRQPPGRDAAPICGVGATADAFPPFGKSCVGDSDCAIALHQTDCCGDTLAIGITPADLTSFNQAEAICRAEYPGCGCPEGPTKAEDGQSSATFNGSDIKVACKQGACSTFLPTAGVQCSTTPLTFPTFNRDCQTVTDCARVTHQIDCCGSTQILGINRSAQADFQSAEAQCEAMLPHCHCRANPPADDAGKLSMTADGSDITVDCVQAQCTSQLGTP